MLRDLLAKGISILAPTEPRFRDSLFGGVATVAGVRVSPEKAMQAVAVYAATSLIAQSIASMPVAFFETGDATRTPTRPDSVSALWDKPNADQSTVDYYESVVLSLLLYGNSYNYVRRNGNGDVSEITPIAPERIADIKRLENPSTGELGLEYEINEFGKVGNVPGGPVNLLHIKGLTLPGRIKGLSPIEQAAQLIGVSLSAEEHSARFLGEGVHMGGVLSSPDKLNKDDAKDLWDAFMLQHAGPKKAGRVGVLTGGSKFEALSIPPSELQFIEQERYTDQKIASLYRVPPHMVGDVVRSTSWGAGITEQTKGFVQHTLTPWLTKIERAVGDAFLPDGLEMEFNVNGLLRGSPKERAERHRTLFNIGSISPNEIRADEGLPPLPDEANGNAVYVPLNLSETGPEAQDLRDAALIAGTLIRAGFEPDEAARVAGLPDIAHLGLLPTTVQVSEDED